MPATFTKEITAQEFYEEMHHQDITGKHGTIQAKWLEVVNFELQNEENFENRASPFILVGGLPIKWLEQEHDPNFPGLAYDYARRTTEAPPIYVKLGSFRLKNEGSYARPRIVNGNHRVVAAKLKGKTTIDALMTYETWRNIRDQGFDRENRWQENPVDLPPSPAISGVFCHGTTSADLVGIHLEGFQPSLSGFGQSGISGVGLLLDMATAWKYADSKAKTDNSSPVVLTLGVPSGRWADLRGLRLPMDIIKAHAEDAGVSVDDIETWKRWYSRYLSSEHPYPLTAILQELGYDGAVIDSTLFDDDAEEYIWFDSDTVEIYDSLSKAKRRNPKKYDRKKRSMLDRWSYTRKFKRVNRRKPPPDDPPDEDESNNLFYISRDTPIIGGVWGSHVRENLYVPEHPILDALTNRVILFSSFRKKSDALKKELNVVDTAYATVRSWFRQKARKNSPNVKSGLVGYYRNKPYVSVWKFAEKGAGVCRHKALVLAAVLEKLKNKNRLSGQISIDRSKSQHRDGGGHAWCRYTDSSGTVWILDIAKSINEALENTFDDNGWAYWRAGDRRYLDLFRDNYLRYRDLK